MSDWRFDQFDFLVEENTKLKELLKLKNEYIAVLGEAESMNAGYLYPKEILDRVELLRTKIKELES